MVLTVRGVLRAAVAVMALAFVAYLGAVKRGFVGPRPEFLGGVATIVLVLGVAWTGAAALAARRGPRRVAAIGEALLAAGISLVAAGGLANWAFGMQGLVVLFERQPHAVHGPADLEAFSGGPLADAGALDFTLALARLRFAPAGKDGFKALSELKLLDATGEERALSVQVGRAAVHRDLVLHQGAFGFSPHLVVAAGGQKVFDEFVPFRTVVDGRGGVGFVGDLEVPAAKLAIRGRITLEDLDDEMRGHPTLELELREGEGPVQGITLKPGEVADLGRRVRVGFTGLSRWAEIDLSHRTYPVPILAGAALFVIGALLWPLGAWRRP